MTYYSNSTSLVFTVNEPTTWIGLSLDGQPLQTIAGNMTFTMADGSHDIIIYAVDNTGDLGTSARIRFYINSSLYDQWKTCFIGMGRYPIVDFALCNGKLYAVSDSKLYVYDGSNWDIVDTPAFAISLESYEDKLYLGGQGGIYSFDGSSFTLVLSVPTYVKSLGVYNNILYVGTALAESPTLYYFNGLASWHIDTGFSDILNFSGPFGGVDSFAVCDGKMYVASGNTVYCFDGTGWSVALSYEYAYAFLDMQAYNGKLYLATRDLNRIPLYMGGTGFSGTLIEYDGENWTTILGHDYWIYSLEVYDDTLYLGTANRICTYNGTFWDVSFYSAEGAYYAVSMITYDGEIYAGMGNGYIFADPDPAKASQEEIVVPEFPSFLILPLFMIATLLAVIACKRKTRRPFHKAYVLIPIIDP
jgi:hypothetical protein